MKDWSEAIPALRKTLAKHFATASEERINHYADEIHSGMIAAASLQWMERKNSLPQQDIDDLERAASALRTAASRISTLGWHGGKALDAVSSEIRQMQSMGRDKTRTGVRGSIEITADFLGWLGDEIQRSAGIVDPNAPSVLSAFGDDRLAARGRGRPKETEANFTAREIYSAFQELSGRTPTVVTDRSSGIAGGPFLALLSDIFVDLNIRANAEKCARDVCKEKNRQSS